MFFQNISIKNKLFLGFGIFFLAILILVIILNSQFNNISSISEKSFNFLHDKEKIDLVTSDGIKKNFNEIKDEISSSKNYSIVIMIICFIIGAVSSIYLSKLITKPILQFVEILKKVNSGDFRIQSDFHSKDETGLLSIQLNELINERKNQVLGFLNESEMINKSTNELLQLSEISESASSEVNTMISSVASTTQEVSGNISSVASASEEMANSIREISSNTSSAATITKEALDKANMASEVMNRLGKSSSEIGNIIKVISTIAEQTNLLALNATIEAARAGELGKGFAVVANEVKELAKESAKSTESITNLIKAIQGDSNNAIDVITEIIQITHKINDISNTIASAIEEQSITVSEVTKNLTEATSGVNSINDTAQGILIATEEVSKITQQVKGSSQNLKMLSEQLENKLKNNFKM